jgi:glycosyltransferase involved in cell wall biosynthesis
MGFEAPSESDVAQLTPYFAEEFPYVLYVGRKETGKGVQTLVDHFVAAKDGGALPPHVKLVVAGGGSFDDLHRPQAKTRADIVDVEHLSELDKRRLIRHAAFLCQPSVNESFSIVLMEAWLLGVPVVVNGRCLVTREHAVESGGGLYFGSADEFAAVARELLGSSDLCAALAAAGRRYVIERYSWSAVLERFDRVVSSIFSEAATLAP